MNQELAWFSIKPHLKNLRICGAYQLDHTSKGRDRFVHKIYMRISISLPIVYALQELAYIYNVRNDTNRVIDSMFLLLSFLDSIYKQAVCWLKADQIESMISILKGPLFNQDVPEYTDMLLKRAQSSKKILRIYNSLTLTTCVLWTLFPLMSFLSGQHVELALWFPFDANKSPRFYYVMIYNYLQTSFLGFNDSTMDSFATMFLAQGRTQIQILRKNLSGLVENIKMLAEKQNISFSLAFHELFKDIILHYNEIIVLINSTVIVFGGAILFQFLVTGLIICTTVYRAINMDPASVEFFSMIFYMMCILVQIFLYCYYGNEITYESLQIINSAYEMNWLELDKYQRKLLIIFMERIKRPLEPKAGALIPLSVGTFITTLRSSHTFYTVLKTTE